MATSPAIPIVIGVGDIKNKSQKIDDALEPLHLMLDAIRIAINDTTLPAEVAKTLQSSIDSVDVVATWTWPYHDLAGLISKELGVKPKHTFYSEHGGNQPGKLFDQAARRISMRKSKVAVVTGGEALASLAACVTAKKMPPPGWATPDPNVRRLDPSDVARLGDNLGGIHSVGLPIQVYPLYENALRAHRKQSIQQNNHESARLYADFAEVASKNPLAWNHGETPNSAKTIGSVSKRNRMICFPYPLLMNAFNTINLAGACLLTSTEYAKELGIPERRWIYPLGGAGTSDSGDFWERPNFYESPAVSRSLDEGIAASGLRKDEIDLFDFYSCFPIVPKLACKHLGLPLVHHMKPITLLGGLTSFGGAGNNYSMHALTEMVRELRKGTSKIGLVLANGGVVTYQHVICLSRHARRDGSPYPDHNSLPMITSDIAIPRVVAQAEGEAVVETYTVDFDRNGAPKLGHVVGRLKSNGDRFLANHGDAETLQELVSQDREPIGRSGWVRPEDVGHRNLFSFGQSARL